jgi:NAD-dependent deacetylase
MAQTPKEPVEFARELIAGAQRIVGLTGAGISTDSGIPDFRGPEGVWTKNPSAERLSTLESYMSDPEIRRRAWQGRLNSPIWQASPNRGHGAFVELERRGQLDTLVTQNIDGLHQLAGNDPAKIVELHGTIRENTCMKCGDRNPADDALDRVRGGEEDPSCPLCGGILKSATISFGQKLVASDLVRAQQAASRCDLILAVGTSLGVRPAAGIVPLAVHHGAQLIIVNGEPTAFDQLASAVLHRPISEVLPDIIAQ